MSFRRRSEGLGRAKVACDACRHKKAKCDGLVPCTRCRDGRNDDICCYSRRVESSEQVFSALYVKMLRRQLHITLSSLRFLVERIALEKDCKVYVPEIDTPINTVINLIQESPEFDHEQNQEFSEMSDSELTMLSPQEIISPPGFSEKECNEIESQGLAHQEAKEDSGLIKKDPGAAKRRASEIEGEPSVSTAPKRSRGRPKKIKRKPDASRATGVIAVPVQEQMSVEERSRSGPRGDSTPLTPTSLRSDDSDTSPIRLHPESSIPELMIRSGDQGTRPPLFLHTHFRPMSLSQAHTIEDSLPMGAVIEDTLGQSIQESAVDMGFIPEPAVPAWDFQSRMPYEAQAISSLVPPELDFFSAGKSAPSNWSVHQAMPPTMVSLNELEYHT